METTRGTWVEVGDSSKLEMTVTKLSPNKEYHFRVKAVNSEGESIPLDTTQAIIAKNPFGMSLRHFEHYASAYELYCAWIMKNSDSSE